MSNANGETAQYYSLQLHPWHLKGRQDIEVFIRQAKRLKEDPYFAAIGECGLDGMCDTPIGLQEEAFRAALALADELQKPIIVHCVKRWTEVMAEAHRHRGLKIIHGFRKGPALARQLLDAGFALSLGRHYHTEVLQIIPKDRLFFETDEICNT